MKKNEIDYSNGFLDRIPVRGDIRWTVLEGEAVLLNPNTGDYFGLNEAGCSFWEKIDEKMTVTEIIEAMLDEYDVTREVLTKDLLELINNMVSHNLLSFK